MGVWGSAILEFASDNNYQNKITRFGVPDMFIEHGSQKEQREESGYSKKCVVSKINTIINKLANHN